MGLEKRKANITFSGPDCATITNYLFQKTFALKKDCVVDLKSMRMEEVNKNYFKTFDSPFFVYFFYNEDEKCYTGMVAMRPGKEKIDVFQNESDIVSYKNNNKTFSASVYVEED